MHVIQKATLFTEITVDECATVSGGTVDVVGSSLGNQLVSNPSIYYNPIIAANNNSGSATTTPTTSTVSNRLLPELAVVSNNLVGI